VDDADARVYERVGKVLDEKWTLERVLGAGGMGAVYEGRHRNGARAAVKILHPELARRPEVRERFLREGYAANRVDHKGAVRVLDDDIVKEGPDADTAYIVMEMLEGEPLEDRFVRGPALEEREVLQLLADVLEAAHRNGVVHRDLKPENLFLTKSGDPRVKVLDFGLARLQEVRGATSAGLALGTPSYMSPEQATGRVDDIDARSDIFALGATAFMLLAGRGVHEADTMLALVLQMGNIPAPRLQSAAPTVSDEVARMVDRACSFKREDRYPSAAEMRTHVLEVLADLDRPGRAESGKATVVDAPSARAAAGDAGESDGATVDRRPSDAGPPRKRSRLLLGTLLVAACGVLLLPQVRARVPQGARAMGERAMGELAGAVTSAQALSATAAGEGAPVPPPASSAGEPAASAAAPGGQAEPPKDIELAEVGSAAPGASVVGQGSAPEEEEDDDDDTATATADAGTPEPRAAPPRVTAGVVAAHPRAPAQAGAPPRKVKGRSHGKKQVKPWQRH